MERLQKVIAESGISSRRGAEKLISEGKVLVNGKVVTEMGVKVSNKDVIEVNGKILEKEEKEYYILNKPRGIITSTSDDKGRKTVVDLIETNTRIYPVGRLDYDTTGILILTNDGEFANRIMHPKNMIEKTYIAKVEGIARGENLIPLEKGVVIDGFKTGKARVKLRKVLKDKLVSYVEITIHEGHNHEVKKMFEAVGLPVIKLKRERIGNLTLDGLNSGEYRRITPKELHDLYNLCNTK